MFNMSEFHQIIDKLKDQVEDPSHFWKTASQLFRSNVVGIKYPEAYGMVKKEDHPALIQDFISNTHSEKYYIRNEIMKLIKES